MSLFHCSEWYNTIISGARCMVVAELINNSGINKKKNFLFDFNLNYALK